MNSFSFNYLRNYNNHGQDAEQSIRYALTGELCKADNVRHDLGSDCLNYQIKSARATICKGTDIDGYLDADASTAYIYGTNDGTAYVMDRNEYKAFVAQFGTLTRESAKNGNTEKIRLKSESKDMLKWLEGRNARPSESEGNMNKQAIEKAINDKQAYIDRIYMSADILTYAERNTINRLRAEIGQLKVELERA